MCVPGRSTNMQCSRMQNEIYGSIVTIQYPAKCDSPPYATWSFLPPHTVVTTTVFKAKSFWGKCKINWPLSDAVMIRDQAPRLKNFFQKFQNFGMLLISHTRKFSKDRDLHLVWAFISIHNLCLRAANAYAQTHLTHRCSQVRLGQNGSGQSSLRQ